MQNEISPPKTINENGSETVQPPRPGLARVRAPRRRPQTTTEEETNLALFTLIADPQTIAGESTEASANAPHAAAEEIGRLRQALHAREQELDALRADADDLDDNQPGIAPIHELSAESPRPSGSGGDLLNAGAAQRLAQDAKEREKASRLALASARQSLRSEGDTPIPAAHALESAAGLESATALESVAAFEADGAEQSWETRPLSVQKHALENAAPQHAAAALPASVQSETRAFRPAQSGRPGRFDIQLRAARAEVRELEATLAIARDTTITQKLEIGRLRSELEQAPEREAATEMAALEEAFKAVLPEEESIDVEAIRIEAQTEIRAELKEEHGALQAEVARLRERLEISEREMEAREDERRIFRETLAAREDELETAQTSLSERDRRLREEIETSEDLRAQLEQERTHNAEKQSVLAQLRNTLGVEPEALTPLAPPAKHERVYTRSEMPSAQQDIREVPQRSSEGPRRQLALSEQEANHRAEPATPPIPNELRAANTLFDAWQDDQVRRHFGPFGIDTSRDLILAPLERRGSTGGRPAKILVLGDPDPIWAERLAEDLIASESPAFELVLGSEEFAPRPPTHERPIDAFLSSTASPESPAELQALLAELQPSIVISRNFLSQVDALGEWLAVLRELPPSGPALVFMESTGVGPVLPPEEMSMMGDRIWSLMPARYTQALGSAGQPDARIQSWQEAFAKMEPLPTNGLRAALRKNFEFEIAAQFGFLTEPFLRSPVAENFDPSAQRDRRFLHQIADLDDRKIEAGIAPALHFVARVDGLAQD
ncbi:MAG: hypothetical protein AB8G23_15245 [Myxococcota bacterium]